MLADPEPDRYLVPMDPGSGSGRPAEVATILEKGRKSVVYTPLNVFDYKE
jgi:hypothetical protein